MSTEENDDNVIEVVEDVPPPVLIVPQVKTFSFEQWAMVRNRQKRHLRGMRAYLGNLAANKYPLEQWDDMMKAY